jgi:hypothetical protein
LRAQGIIPCGGTAQEFASFILGETEKWRPIVAQLHGVTAQKQFGAADKRGDFN